MQSNRVSAGNQYGCYTILRADENRSAQSGHKYWICQCSCGKTKSVRGEHLCSGRVVSCGCHKDKIAGDRMRTHGKSNTTLYRIYKHIRGRCYCTTDERYSDYGGRGIAMCIDWYNDFMSFYDWAIANGYSGNLTIDRIDNNKGYSPDNCRWAGRYTQANNKRNNRYIEYGGIKLTVSQWARRIGINPKILDNRLRRGWSEERALTQPLRIRKN